MSFLPFIEKCLRVSVTSSSDFFSKLGLNETLKVMFLEFSFISLLVTGQECFLLRFLEHVSLSLLSWLSSSFTSRTVMLPFLCHRAFPLLSEVGDRGGCRNDDLEETLGEHSDTELWSWSGLGGWLGDERSGESVQIKYLSQKKLWRH